MLINLYIYYIIMFCITNTIHAYRFLLVFVPDKNLANHSVLILSSMGLSVFSNSPSHLMKKKAPTSGLYLYGRPALSGFSMAIGEWIEHGLRREGLGRGGGHWYAHKRSAARGSSLHGLWAARAIPGLEGWTHGWLKFQVRPCLCGNYLSYHVLIRLKIFV